jgi:RNA polymerase sigma-70 factor (ECF subfamily)
VRFETLIEEHHDEIYRYIWRLLKSSGRTDRAVEAQDLTQEVFTRAYQAFGRLRQDSNHRAWLYRIATNCTFTALKRGKRLSHHRIDSYESRGEEVVFGAPQPSPAQQVVFDEVLRMVREAIRQLPPKQQTAVVLRHLQGLDYVEIAQVLDCSQDSARANVYQGLRHLRHELADAHPWE